MLSAGICFIIFVQVLNRDFLPARPKANLPEPPNPKTPYGKREGPLGPKILFLPKKLRPLGPQKHLPRSHGCSFLASVLMFVLCCSRVRFGLFFSARSSADYSFVFLLFGRHGKKQTSQIPQEIVVSLWSKVRCPAGAASHTQKSRETMTQYIFQKDENTSQVS